MSLHDSFFAHSSFCLLSYTSVASANVTMLYIYCCGRFYICRRLNACDSCVSGECSVFILASWHMTQLKDLFTSTSVIYHSKLY